MPESGRIEESFTGVGGGRIHLRAWISGTAMAQVVIVHGYGEHGDRYTRFARRLADEGFSVWANDHRGHGRSEGHRGVVPRLDDAVADVDHVIDLAREERPDLPIFMFAHSMGGTIGLRYAIRHQDKLAGLVLSSAAVSLEGLDVPGIQRKIVKLIGRIAPRLPVNRLPLEGISRDPEEERIYRGDPLVHLGAQPARTVTELLDAMSVLPDEVAGLRIPLLVIAGSADPIVPAAGSREIAERAGSPDKRIIVYEGFVHELINEPPEDRERVTGDVIEWLRAHLPPDPGESA
ncbi:MAG TPA: lysophospholipase [Solirubrobacterales bacterium]|nr:lysophospholipase [Solirubrobacterales bacterium]